MQYQNVRIAGTGYNLPEQILTSSAIELQIKGVLQKFGLQDGFLAHLTGVHSRRVWPVGTKPSSVAAIAARQAISRAGLDQEIIGAVIHAGVCRDALEPATATVAHQALGLASNCMAFDVSNACLGFLNAMCVAANMIELGHIKAAVVISGENAGPIYQDTIAAINKSKEKSFLEESVASLTLGSGAVAYVLCHKDILPDAPALKAAYSLSDSSGCSLCEGNGDLHHQTMRTNTRELMQKGLKLIVNTWAGFCEQFRVSNATFKHYFCHQISRSHHSKLMQAIGIKIDEDCRDLHSLGNTGSVAAPLSMALRDNDNKLRRGDRIALLGIGSGINTMIMDIQW